MKNDNINKDCYFFWGGFCSNWHPANFEYKGLSFVNSEQAFMWEKAKFFDDSNIASQILQTEDPTEAKKLGRLINNFNAYKWAEVSYQIMYNVNLAKFEQNHKLQTALKETNDLILVEASPYDNIWGIGLDANKAEITPKEEWEGTNWLGLVLMEVREFFNKTKKK